MSDRAAMRYEYPIADDFMADLRLPRDLKRVEAERLCAFMRTLVVDEPPKTPEVRHP